LAITLRTYANGRTGPTARSDELLDDGQRTRGVPCRVDVRQSIERSHRVADESPAAIVCALHDPQRGQLRERGAHRWPTGANQSPDELLREPEPDDYPPRLDASPPLCNAPQEGEHAAREIRQASALPAPLEGAEHGEEAGAHAEAADITTEKAWPAHMRKYLEDFGDDGVGIYYRFE
jgi:hypothetical protein